MSDGAKRCGMPVIRGDTIKCTRQFGHYGNCDFNIDAAILWNEVSVLRAQREPQGPVVPEPKFKVGQVVAISYQNHGIVYRQIKTRNYLTDCWVYRVESLDAWPRRESDLRALTGAEFRG